MIFTILGAAGFVGGELVRELRRRGHQVHSVGRGEPLPDSRNLGHVFFCIGITSDFRTKPFATMQAHVAALEPVLQHGGFESFTYLSSTRVYKRASDTHEGSDVPVQVGDADDLYNISKLAGESLCLSCERANVRVARLSNVVGASDSSNNFLSDIVRSAVAGHISFRSALNSAKDYILVDDVVDLLIRIGTSGMQPIYNVASGGNTTHETIAVALQSRTDCTFSVTPDAPEISFPIINTSRIRSEFAFTAQPIFDLFSALVDAARQTARNTIHP